MSYCMSFIYFSYYFAVNVCPHKLILLRDTGICSTISRARYWTQMVIRYPLFGTSCLLSFGSQPRSPSFLDSCSAFGSCTPRITPVTLKGWIPDSGSLRALGTFLDMIRVSLGMKLPLSTGAVRARKVTKKYNLSLSKGMVRYSEDLVEGCVG
jgi:hypothetical protein